MKHPVTLSVIIPVYNAADTITNIVNHLLRQDFTDFELILVDDGSSDNSYDIITQFAKKDARVRAYTKQNGGPSSARNFGLNKARGRYIQFYDADDDITEQALHTTLQAAATSQADMVVSGWKIYRERSGKTTVMSPDHQAIRGNLVDDVLASIGRDGTLYNLWNKLFRTDIIQQHRLRFREDVRFGEDLIFALHYLQHASSLYIIPDVTYVYHIREGVGEFNRHSITLKYRSINDKELELFAGSKRSQKTDELFQWVRWRWLLSFWILVSGSTLPFQQKLLRIRQNSKTPLPVAKSGAFIGKKKWCIERIAYTFKRIPFLAFLCGKIIFIGKRIFAS